MSEQLSIIEKPIARTRYTECCPVKDTDINGEVVCLDLWDRLPDCEKRRAKILCTTWEDLRGD